MIYNNRNNTSYKDNKSDEWVVFLCPLMLLILMLSTATTLIQVLTAILIGVAVAVIGWAIVRLIGNRPKVSFGLFPIQNQLAGQSSYLRAGILEATFGELAENIKNNIHPNEELVVFGVCVDAGTKRVNVIDIALTNEEGTDMDGFTFQNPPPKSIEAGKQYIFYFNIRPKDLNSCTYLIPRIEMDGRAKYEAQTVKGKRVNPALIYQRFIDNH